MGILVSEIAEKFLNVQDMIEQKMKEMLDGNNNVIKFIPSEAKKLKLYTQLDICEVGLDNAFAGGVYVKDKSGCLNAFTAMDINRQYNLISLMDEML